MRVFLSSLWGLAPALAWLFPIACERRPATEGPSDAGATPTPSAVASALTLLEPPRLFRGRAGSALVRPPIGGVSGERGASSGEGGQSFAFLSTALELKLCMAGPASPLVACYALAGLAQRDRYGGREVQFTARLADAEDGTPYPIVDRGNPAKKPIVDGILTDRDVMTTDTFDVGVDRFATFVHVTRDLGLARDRFLLRRTPKDDLIDRHEPPIVFESDSPRASVFVAMPWILFGDPTPDTPSSERGPESGKRAADAATPAYKTRIRARKATSYLESVGPWIDAGVIPEYTFTVRAGCRSKEGLALVLDAPRPRVLFERGGAFTLVDAGELPVEGPDPVQAGARVDCDGERVAISVARRATLVDGKPPVYAMTQIVCGPEGCERFAVRFEAPGAPPYKRGTETYVLPEPRLGWVAGKRLVVWETPLGSRMRFGDVEHGDGAPLFPAHVSGATLFVHGRSVYAFSNHRTEWDVVGARIDADANGQITMLTRSRPQ